MSGPWMLAGLVTMPLWVLPTPECVKLLAPLFIVSNEELTAGRPLATTPIYDRLSAAGNSEHLLA